MSTPGAPSKVLQITSYPPPRAGWGIRVQFLKQRLEAEGHTCVVLNIGTSRMIPSTEYETVLSGSDYVSKVWRFTRAGFLAHVHVNGASPKGFVLAILAELIQVINGRRPVLTFHAGIEQVYFPRAKAPMLVPVYWVLFGLPRTIICNSAEVKAKIVEYGVDPARVAPIPAFSTQYMEFVRKSLPEAVDACFARFPKTFFSYLRVRELFYPLELIEGFARVARARPDVGLVLCGTAGHTDGDLPARVQRRIDELGVRDRVAVVEDLDHDAFLTAMERSVAYLRTHMSDGVCSSVMEALAMGKPVVATENFTRPAGVLTYAPTDVERLVAHLEAILQDPDGIATRAARPEVRDTLADEVRVLTA